jgi:hypothetical protein
MAKSQRIAEDLAQEGPIVFEEQYLTLHNAQYNKKKENCR